MEYFTIYSHRLAFETIKNIIQKHLPKSTISTKKEKEIAIITATKKGGFFAKNETFTVNYREREIPSYTMEKVECELTQNLAGMANFVQELPTDKEDLKEKLIYKILSTNSEFTCIYESKQNVENLLKDLVKETDSFAFVRPHGFLNKSNEQYFADQNLNLLFDLKGKNEVDDLEVNIDAKYYDQDQKDYTEEQLLRKVNTEQFLEQHHIKVNTNLPCLPSGSSLELQPLKSIIDRAYALLIMGVKGEGIEQEHLEKAVKHKNITSFSPREQYVYEAQELTEEDRLYATWRYEALYLMLWALNKIEELRFPNEICDVKEVVDLIFTPSREEFEQSAQLRSKEEILNKLDETYRMHWACVDARIQGKIIKEIIPSIIYERHYALNWLVNLQNVDWDEVHTNT